MVEIAVVGNSAFGLGFQLAGIRKFFEVNNLNSNAKEQLHIARNDPEVGIMITDETTIKSVDDQLREEIENAVKPVCIILSTNAGSQDSLRKMIIKSIGVDLMQGEANGEE